MLIKICGLRRLQDIDYVNAVKVDMAGFVFAPSKRQVNIEQARELKEHLSKGIKSVGVFVDEDISTIKKIVDQKIIDIVQLHGHEDNDYIARLKETVEVPIIKALKIESEDDLNKHYDVDCYLLDNKIAGSGESFDWNLIKALDKPYLLAGGIDLSNVREALKYGEIGIDVSSGVESDGYKDFNKIKEIVRIVRDEKR